MEPILTLLFESLGDLLLQFLFEALAEVGVHALRKPAPRKPSGSGHAVVGHGAAGALAGAISVWLFPASLVASRAGRIASLLVTPFAVGAAMSLLGAWRRKRGQDLVRLDRFTYGYVFALAMAAVRFFLAAA